MIVDMWRRHGRLLLALMAVLASNAISGGVSPTLAEGVARKDTLILDATLQRIATPQNYNPFLPTTTLQGGLHQVGYESLFYLNLETGKLIPWQAESYQFNPAYDEVTIKLRKGITWSDGVPFTADDVVFTMNMLKDHAAGLGNWGGQAKRWIKNISAVDPQTVKIELTAPDPNYVTDIFGDRVWQTNQIVPKHIWEGKDPLTFSFYDPAKGWPVTTSPYKLVSASNEETVWDRRDDWWGAKTGFSKLPAPKRVIFTAAGSEERRVAMLINNDLDTAYSIGKDSFETVHAKNPKVVTWLPQMPYAYTDAGPRALHFNNQLPPFNDPRVRWAISYAINRDALVDISWEGMSQPIPWVAPSLPALKPFFEGVGDLFQKYPTDEYNLDKVAENMKAAGFSKDSDGFWADGSGKRLTIDLIALGNEADGTKSAPVVNQMLRRAGFDSQFRLLESAAYYDATALGKAGVWLGGVSGGVTNPYATFEMYSSAHSAPIGKPATPPYVRFENGDYDKIVAEMARLPSDDPQYKDLIRKGLEIWLQQLPSAPLTDAKLLASYNNTYWKNWPTSDNNYMQPCFWWASALVSITRIEPAS